MLFSFSSLSVGAVPEGAMRHEGRLACERFYRMHYSYARRSRTLGARRRPDQRFVFSPKTITHGTRQHSPQRCSLTQVEPFAANEISLCTYPNSSLGSIASGV
jgi:hypothetical protein